MNTFFGNSKFFLLLRFYSWAVRRAFLTLALRDCPRWIIVNVSCEQRDTSEMLSSASRFCICRMLLMNFSRAPLCEKFSRLTTNRRIMRRRETQGMCRERKKKRKKGKNAKSNEYKNAAHVMEIFQDFVAYIPRRDIGPRPSDIPRELPRGIPSRRQPSKRRWRPGILRDGNISRITVGWGTLRISWRNTLAQTRFWWNNNRDVFQVAWRFLSPVLSLLLGELSPFYISLREVEKKLKTWAQRSHESLLSILYTTCTEESQAHQFFDATIDVREIALRIQNTYLIDWNILSKNYLFFINKLYSLILILRSWRQNL